MTEYVHTYLDCTLDSVDWLLVHCGESTTANGWAIKVSRPQQQLDI